MIRHRPVFVCLFLTHILTDGRSVSPLNRHPIERNDSFLIFAVGFLEISLGLGEVDSILNILIHHSLLARSTPESIMFCLHTLEAAEESSATSILMSPTEVC